MTLFRQAIIVVMLAIIGGAGWFWFTDGSGVAPTEAARRGEKPPTLVHIQPVVLRADTVVYSTIGTAEAVRSASLYPKSEGEVVEVLFQPGRAVQEGDPLIRLSGIHQQLDLQLADVAAKEADRIYRRFDKLAKNGAVSTVRLQEARIARENARLNLAQAEAAVQDRIVFAPFSGTIGLSDVDVGDRVDDDTLIAMLGDHSALNVHFVVPEEFAAEISVGDKVSLKTMAMRADTADAKISAVDSRIDPKTRSLSVRARVENPGRRLRPGTSFTVEMQFTGKTYPAIPEVAVLWSKAGAYIWRVNDNMAEKVTVAVIRRSNGQVLVDGALAAGEDIVIEGVQGLRHGQQVLAKPLIN